MGQESHDFLHFFENARDMLCIAGLDGYFKRLNPAWQRTLGFSNEELQAKPYLAFVHPDDVPATLAEAQKISEGQHTIHFRNRYICKDGGYRWFTWRASLDDESQTIHAMATDITEHQQMEERLLHISEWQQAILESANLAVISTSPDGVIQTFNRCASRMLGYSPEEVIGKVSPEIFHDRAEVERRAAELSQELGREVRAGFETIVARARLGMADEYEWTYLPKDGNRLPVLLSVTALRDTKGGTSGFLGIARDIAQRKSAEENLKSMTAELVRSNAELEQFAYVASHDLQEPLRMVTNFLKLLEQQLGENLDADSSTYLTTAMDGARRMRALINDLLSYSRVGTKGKPLVPTRVEDAIGTVLNDLEVMVQEQEAVVTHDHPLPVVLADEGQLRQLLQNLIANAIKFHSERTPKVHISAQRAGAEMWELAVSDNGIGIEPEHFERIFVIFQRLHSRVAFEGTGIGLAICKKIVERHGGRIRVTSRLGEGTTFHFTLRAAPDAPSRKGENNL